MNAIASSIETPNPHSTEPFIRLCDQPHDEGTPQTDATPSSSPSLASVKSPQSELPTPEPLLPYSTWLPQEIRDRRLPIPSNSSPAEAMPWVQKFIDRHNQIGQLIPINAHGREQWEALMHDWQTFLAKLQQTIAAQREQNEPRNGKNKIPTAEPGKNSELIHHQQTSTRNEPGMNPEQPGIRRNGAEPPRNNPGEPRNESGTPRKEPSSFPSLPSVKNPDSEITNPQSSPTPSAKTSPADEEFQEAAAELPFRLKGRSRFDQLTSDQQSAIIALLEIYNYTVVLQLIAEPAPIGFSFKIGKSALFDFKARFRKREAERRKKESTDRALELLNKSENPGATFLNLYERFLHVKALTIASDSDASLDELDQLTSTLTKLRKQTLAERKQRHREIQ